MLNEIVVISGKGGTGKTTLTSSLIPYIEDKVIADCDVDAPDLYILTSPEIKEIIDFVGTKKAVIDYDRCTYCGLCYQNCRFGAISEDIRINIAKCEGCGVCAYVCPTDAISMKDIVVGNIFISETKWGPMVHARLIPGEETSGKLVSEVRLRAKKIANELGKSNLIVDGTPGVACNVISSITGAGKVIIVTEPTNSGLHDLKRVYELVKSFKIKTFFVINKYDLNIEMTEKIEAYLKSEGEEFSLKIPFNKEVVNAIVERQIPSLVLKDFFEDIGFFKFIEKLF